MKNELQKHKKSDGVKWFAVFLAVILLAVAITAASTQGFTNWNSYGWFDKTTESPVNDSSAPMHKVIFPAHSNTVDFMSADTVMPTAITIKPNYMTTKSGTFMTTCRCTDNGEMLDVDVAWEHQQAVDSTGQWTPSGSPGTIYMTVLTISTSRYPDYTNFQISIPGKSFATSGNSWTRGETVSEEVLQTMTMTCESVWEYVPLPADPVKEGYTFTGWYLNEECTQLYIGETVREDITLYAGFTINTYTITLNVDGGDVLDNVTSDYNTTPAIPTPMRRGYNFLGWYKADGTVYDSATPLKADVTLTAKWEIKTFTVKFYVDGEVYKTMTVKYGTSLIKQAEQLYLNVLTVQGEDTDEPLIADNGGMIVTGNCLVVAQEMGISDKAINTVKQNKWIIIGGVVGGIVLIAVIGSLCGGIKRKKRQ